MLEIVEQTFLVSHFTILSWWETQAERYQRTQNKAIKVKSSKDGMNVGVNLELHQFK